MDSTMIKPMKAATVKSLEMLQFPLYVQPKLDGIRALVSHGKVYSRSGELIPNIKVQEAYGHLHGYDGELLMDTFAETSSAVMSIAGNKLAKYVPYDNWSVAGGYAKRWHTLKDGLPFEIVNSIACVREVMNRLGGEGIILRKPGAFYYHGASTLNSGSLLRIKNFETSEAKVIGFECLNRSSLQSTSPLGYAKNSHKAEHKIPQDMLGSLLCQTVEGVIFSVGTGFTVAQKKEIWKNQRKYLGQYISYQHLPFGALESPRSPSFRGWRPQFDIIKG